MACANPYFIGNSVVPCGHCLQCRQSKTREWSARLMHELKYHSSAMFITLTYDENHLPKFNSLCKRDLQLFFKRLRRSLDERKIKYFACGEYGGKYERPHYHIILFGLGVCHKCICCKKGSIIKPMEDCEYVYDAWGLGLVNIGNVTHQSCMYTAKYIQKKLNGKLGFKKYGDRQHPYMVCSKGIGLQYCYDNSDMLLDRLGVPCNGKTISLPNYYRKKLDISDDIKLLLFQLGKLRFEKYLLSVGIAPEDLGTVIEEVKRYGKQKELNLKAKLEIYKKGGIGDEA